MPRSEKVLGRTFLSYIGGGQDDVICVKKAETPTFAIFCLKFAQISGKFKDRNAAKDLDYSGQRGSGHSGA